MMELVYAMGWLLGMVVCFALAAAPLILGILIYLNVRKIAKNSRRKE